MGETEQGSVWINEGCRCEKLTAGKWMPIMMTGADRLCGSLMTIMSKHPILTVTLNTD